MSETLWLDPEDRSLLAEHGLKDRAAFFVWSRGQCLDKPGLASWRQRWRIELPEAADAGRARTFYLKRFQSPPLARQWERVQQGHAFRGTAGIEWHNGCELARAGISAARPAAFGQAMTGPWERQSFILLREVEGVSLERWLPENVPPAARETDWAVRRALIDGLADFVARFHRAGFVHRDLYLCHIFIRSGVTRLGSGTEPFTLIDLQRVFQPRWRGRRWVVKDLAALNFSTPADRVGHWERLRFLSRYARACGRFGSARNLARLIEAKTARIAARHPAPQAGPWTE